MNLQAISNNKGRTDGGGTAQHPCVWYRQSEARAWEAVHACHGAEAANNALHEMGSARQSEGTAKRCTHAAFLISGCACTHVLRCTCQQLRRAGGVTTTKASRQGRLGFGFLLSLTLASFRVLYCTCSMQQLAAAACLLWYVIMCDLRRAQAQTPRVTPTPMIVDQSRHRIGERPYQRDTKTSHPRKARHVAFAFSLPRPVVACVHGVSGFRCLCMQAAAVFFLRKTCLSNADAWRRFIRSVYMVFSSSNKIPYLTWHFHALYKISALHWPCLAITIYHEEQTTGT